MYVSLADKVKAKADFRNDAYHFKRDDISEISDLIMPTEIDKSSEDSNLPAFNVDLPSAHKLMVISKNPELKRDLSITYSNKRNIYDLNAKQSVNILEIITSDNNGCNGIEFREITYHTTGNRNYSFESRILYSESRILSNNIKPKLSISINQIE